MSELSIRQLVHRDQAEKLMDRIYAVMRQEGWGKPVKAANAIRLKGLNAEYDAWMAKAPADWHCVVTDPEAFSLFSDLYKDDNGFRPRGHYTRAQVRHWLDSRSE